MKRISTLGAAGLLFSFSVAASATPRDEGRFQLRILSYNVKGLPGIAGGYRNGERFEEIGRELRAMKIAGQAPQIVLMQEAFVKATNEIREFSGYEHTYKGPKASDPDEDGKSTLKLFNSGIVTLSDYPIVAAAKVAFGKGKCGTWDCFANKGVQLSMIEIPELPFHLPVMNTHLQATRERNEDRIKQMGVIKRFMSRFLGPVQPLIFAGDFNTRPNSSSYDWFAKNMGLYNIGEICMKEITRCVVAEGTPVDRLNVIDQHYAISGVAGDRGGSDAKYAVRIEPSRVEKTFTKLVKGKPLSDHLGYQVDYDISWYRML
ncbi:MAG: endonuclease/exonuclease/phosphatase family protein [Bdellovibrionota bacterium]